MRDAADRAAAIGALEEDLGELRIEADDARAELLRATITEEMIDEIRTFALDQNMTSLRNRIDQLGVAEPVVQQQGEQRIVIQLPGVQDTERAKRILGRAATLEMRLVDEKNTTEAEQSGQAPPGARLYRFRDGRRILLKKQIIYSGESIVDAAASIDSQTGSPIVSITLDAAGASKNSRVTAENINNRMAVVYVEATSEIERDASGNVVVGDDGQPVRNSRKIEEVLTAPVIRDQLGKRFQIEGLDSVEEARDLALMLRSGALAAPVEIIEERTVGPSLGQANISQGFTSVTVGFLLVLVFMLFYYKMFGIAANVALAVNLVLMVAVLSFFQATLTLPGVAGIVLTVGMAVDANVLIFERIREEIRNGNSPQASIHMGYDKALSTIVDANVTTLIAGDRAVQLWHWSDQGLCGDAQHRYPDLHVHGDPADPGAGQLFLRRQERPQAGDLRETNMQFLNRTTTFDFLGKRKIALAISLIVIVISIGALVTRGLNFGIDFTGGTLVEVGYSEAVEIETVRSALETQGFDDAIVQYFGTSRDVLIRLPADASAESVKAAELSSAVMRALRSGSAETLVEQSGAELQQCSRDGVTGDCSLQMRRVEFVGPQVGEELAEQGGLAMLYALIGILIYVTFRFEWRFAVGSVVALVHDVIITIGIFALFQFEFSLAVLAAVLAVIGYSLNDTIVVYDRIRENFRKLRKGEPVGIMNTSINQTLPRTALTSVTTLLVVLTLLIFGGEVIRGFSLALTVGVIVGTYSSIFVAAPAVLALGITREDMMPVVKEGAEADAAP